MIEIQEMKVNPADLANKLNIFFGQAEEIEELKYNTEMMKSENLELVYDNIFMISLSNVHSNKPSTKWKYPISGKFQKATVVDNDPMYKYEQEYEFQNSNFIFYLNDSEFCKRLQKAFEFVIQYFNPPKREVF